MADTFKEARQENLESGYVFGNTDHFAESITYTPPGGPAVTCATTVHYDKAEDQNEEGHRRRYRRAWCTITANPDSNRGGVASPSEAGTVTIGTTQWTIEAVTPSAAGWRLDLTRATAREMTRPNYRRV